MSRRALALIAGSLISTAPLQAQDSTRQAQRLFQRIAGVPLMPYDARLATMSDLVAAGDWLGAGAIATDDPAFYAVTLKTLGATMGSVDESPYAEFNDFQAMIMGIARDDRDARELLTADAAYAPRGSRPSPSNNSVYRNFEAHGGDYRDGLERLEPQWQAPLVGGAGLLTSRGWGEAHLVAGTNRRAAERSFRIFFQMPIDRWKEPNLPEWHIRRDVSRAPAGNPETFATVCRSCHAILDGLAGAYARYDFDHGKWVYVGPNQVAAKYNKNAATFPSGYVTADDSWINQTATNQSAIFGWRGPTNGRGLHAFGVMLANSQAFSKGLTGRIYAQICGRPPGPADDAAFAALVADFEATGYRLRRLYADVAASPGCVD